MSHDEIAESKPHRLQWVIHWMTDTGVFVIAQGLAVLASFAAVVLISRSLGPSTYGQFATAFAVAQAVQIVLDFGLFTFLLREFTRDDIPAGNSLPSNANELLGGALTLNRFATACLIALALVGAYVSGWDADLTIVLASLIGYGGLSAASLMTGAGLRATRRVRIDAGISVAEKVLLVSLCLASTTVDGGLIGFGIAYLLAGTFRYVALRVALLRTVHLRPVRVARDFVRDLAKKVWPMLASQAAILLIPRLDLVVIAAVSGTGVAFFALGDRIMAAVVILPTILATTLFPFLGRDSSERRRRQLLGLSVAAGLVVGAPLIFGAPWFVPAIFGHEYRSASTTVAVLTASTPFIFISNIAKSLALSEGYERRVARMAGIISIGMIPAVVVGAAFAGAVGAAVAVTSRQALLAAALVHIALFWSGRAADRSEAGTSSDSGAGPTIGPSAPTEVPL